jgi:hypothetical protein
MIAVLYCSTVLNCQRSDIRIGGIGGGIIVTHLLELYMSYTINGQHTKIIFGLTENLPITAIIGLPFFVQAEGVIDLAEQRIVSQVVDCLGVVRWLSVLY